MNRRDFMKLLPALSAGTAGVAMAQALPVEEEVMLPMEMVLEESNYTFWVWTGHNMKRCGIVEWIVCEGPKCYAQRVNETETRWCYDNGSSGPFERVTKTWLAGDYV